MSALFNRNFTLLWQGQLVSHLGNQAFMIAASYFVLGGTGSASLVALVMIASTLPLVILGPIGGAVADRHSRRAILVATDLTRAAVMAGIGLLLLVRPEPTILHVTVLVAGAVLNGIMAALFAPAMHAIVPDLVPGERLASANALSQISSQTSMMVGQALGGVLYVALGAAALLIFDGLSFLYAGLSTWWITTAPRAPQKRRAPGQALREYARATREGLAYLRGQRGMMTLLTTFAGVNVLFMPVFVLLPVYVGEALGRGPEWYGFLLAGSGGGALAGSAAAGRLVNGMRHPATLLAACMAGVSCSVLAIAAAREPVVALAAFVAIGTLSSVINVTVVTAFQTASPAAIRGRVMALVIALSSAAVPLGMLAGGLAGDVWRDSIRAVFMVCGLAIGVLVVLASRSFEAALPRTYVPETTLP